MEPRESDLEKLGKSLHGVLSTHGSEHEELRRARKAFLLEFANRHVKGLSAGTKSRGRGLWRLALAASLGAAAVATVLSWPRATSFHVGESHAGRLGDLIEAMDGRPTPLQFSEGSRLLLHEGGKLRVLSFDAEAARVLVEDGVLDVSVAHQKSRKTRWDFEAGPYRVKVTGTKFRMAFHSRSQHFTLSTEEGQVVVSDGCQQTSRTVSAGENVDLTCPPVREEPPSVGHAGTSAPAPAEAPPQPEQEAARERTRPAVHTDAAWRGLLESGRLSEGLAAAKHQGLQRVCRLAMAQELLTLADAGRLFGSAADAIAPLRVLRQRFPGSTDAATAAFRLGLIAYEKQHAYAEAAQWFEIYMRDQPSGPLMGDSFGRLMQARSRAGDTQRARLDAQQYLRRFPEGPYALEARGILSK
jgi:transmembrane sensor